MASTAVVNFTVMRRNTTLVKRELIRASKAVEIAGPNLRPVFESRLFHTLQGFHGACGELVGALNSGALDLASDEVLADLNRDLANVVLATLFVAETAKKLPFRRKARTKVVVHGIEEFARRLSSVKEGIDFSQSEEMITSLSVAAHELIQERSLAVQ